MMSKKSKRCYEVNRTYGFCRTTRAVRWDRQIDPVDPQCVRGPPGINGKDDKDGQSGPRGPQGETGTTGAQGPDGLRSLAGTLHVERGNMITGNTLINTLIRCTASTLITRGFYAGNEGDPRQLKIIILILRMNFICRSFLWIII